MTFIRKTKYWLSVCFCACSYWFIEKCECNSACVWAVCQGCLEMYYTLLRISLWQSSWRYSSTPLCVYRCELFSRPWTKGPPSIARPRAVIQVCTCHSTQASHLSPWWILFLPPLPFLPASPPTYHCQIPILLAPTGTVLLQPTPTLLPSFIPCLPFSLLYAAVLCVSQQQLSPPSSWPQLPHKNCASCAQTLAHVHKQRCRCSPMHVYKHTHTNKQEHRLLYIWHVYANVK